MFQFHEISFNYHIAIKLDNLVVLFTYPSTQQFIYFELIFFYSTTANVEFQIFDTFVLKCKNNKKKKKN